MKIIIKSHAKINFGLNIISRRSDGFHNLNTIFYPIGLHDTIVFEKADSLSLQTDSITLSGDINSNLIIKAVRLLETHTGKTLPVKIFLEKRIPMGAGLGGGSSNAACSLLSMNDLYRLNLKETDFMNLAGNLGSDVACFIKPYPTFGESRGEIVSPLNFKISKPLVLVNPGIHVSTPWAYGNITPKNPEYDLRSLVNSNLNNYEIFRDKISNDFEIPVFRNYPEIKALKEDFYASGAEFALMSGSGSTVFGIFSNDDDAVQFAGKYTNKFFVYTQLKEENEEV